jgi:pimeloyl-ACP methyl ester carboxylesterase
MPDRPIVLLHGWSDSSRSFQRLAQHLAASRQRAVVPIRLADYVSMLDELRLDDLVQAMDRAWDAAGLGRTPQHCDAVVHSTGALVMRSWLTQFALGAAPVHRLLMLAPANFGSPLAHKGHSFLGRAVKGFRSPRTFQTGERLLEALELASAETRTLAEADVLAGASPFGRDGILATVLVGNVGFGGIKSIANADGSDGTVRASTAALSATHSVADFATDPQQPTLRSQRTRGRTALRICDGENHTSIAMKDRGPRDPAVATAIVEALQVTPRDFEAWADDCAAHTAAVTAAAESAVDRARSGYHTLVTRLRDHLGAPVRDYFLEFYRDDAVDRQDRFAERFHRDVISKVHVNSRDPSRRAMLIDRAALDRVLTEVPSLRVSVSATPDIATHGYVGYRTFTDAGIGGLTLTADALRGLLPRHETSFLDLVIRREQSARVFTIR